ncbi:hypothetical protein [Clostridium sp.]|uniref:hypothetical protein n=1 Tax=Clostridium sp. TaxID=1506 RepID=UPI003F3F3F2B
MNTNVLLAILIILIVCSIFLIIYVFTYAKKNPRIKKSLIKSSRNDFFYNSYVILNKYTLPSKYLSRIRRRIELVEVVDNWTICRRTMQLAYMSSGIAAICLIVLLLSSNSLYFIFISIVIVYVIHEEVFSSLIIKADDRLMKQLEKAIGDIRHLYHQHEMVEEALYDTVELCDYEIAQHINEMHQALISDDIDTAINNYYEKAPNKFLKTFLSLCYTVVKFGDKEVEQQSLFLTNLNYLKEELNVEILKREKIRNNFMGLSYIAIAPIFLVKLIELWGMTYMPELEIYYKGAYGLIADIILFLTSITAYYVVGKLKSPYYEVNYFSFIEEKLLKISLIKRLVTNVMNKKYNEVLKIQAMMKTTGTKAKVEYFYLKRMLYAISGFLLSILIVINAININKNNLITLPIGLEDYKAVHSVYSIDTLMNIDRTYILEYKGQENLSYEKIEKKILEKGDITDKKVAKESAERILGKIEKYNKYYFKWIHLILAFIVALIFYSIPYLILAFRKKLIEMAMEEEVFQFHSILLMLMHVERITVDNILEWLEQFSSIFKDSIRKCIMNFEADDNKALEELKKDESFTPFIRVVENLQSASERIGVLQAFDTLKADRIYYSDKRKQDNEIMIRNKSSIGSMISFSPLTLSVILYLLIPMVLSSINYLSVYVTQMETIM